jgi:hypothetical protein
MKIARQNLPLYIVVFILSIGLLIGIALSNREQSLREQAVLANDNPLILLAANFPIPTDAQRISPDANTEPSHLPSYTETIALKTSASVYNIIQFYLAALPEAGWEIIQSPPDSEQASLQTLIATKNGHSAYITIEKQLDVDQITHITVSLPETTNPTTFNRNTPVTPNESEITFAFISNTGTTNQTEQVTNLIKNEEVQAVVHLGNFDLSSNPQAFKKQIEENFDPDFPYFYTAGDHDLTNDSWRQGCSNPQGCYAQDFIDRLELTKTTVDYRTDAGLVSPTGSDDYSAVLGDVKLVNLGLAPDLNQTSAPADQDDNLELKFIKASFENENSPWKLCLWNQPISKVADQGQITNWAAYDECRQQGAIIVTADDFNYARSKTISDFETLKIAQDWTQPGRVTVNPGQTIVVQSGLGGLGVKTQNKCEQISFPFGCQDEWANLYSANQQARSGVLFITFNWQGDSSKARGYFKNINNQVVDDFTISTSTVLGASCPGDIDLNGTVDMQDYTLLSNDFLSLTPEYPDADINGDGIVNSTDKQQLIDNLFASCQL